MMLHTILHRACILIKDAHTSILFWDWHGIVAYLTKRRKAELIRAKRMTYVNLKWHLYLNVQNTLVSSWTIAAAGGENKFIALQVVRVGKIFLKSINSILEMCLLQLAFPVLSADYLVYQKTATRMNMINTFQLKCGQSERACIASSVCLVGESNL